MSSRRVATVGWLHTCSASLLPALNRRWLPWGCLAACRAEEVAEDAARLGYSVGQGDRGEAAVYWCVVCVRACDRMCVDRLVIASAAQQQPNAACHAEPLLLLPRPACLTTLLLCGCSPALDDMLTPEELSTWVLQHLKQAAEEQLGEAVTGAVGGRPWPGPPALAAEACCRCLPPPLERLLAPARSSSSPSCAAHMPRQLNS